MTPDEIEQAFPKLRSSGYDITSPADPRYNCIAWAAERNDRWWWPNHPFDSGYYWPMAVPNDERLETFVTAFEMLGYEPCPDAPLETDFEHVAIFVKDDRVSHAARQLPDGTWTSKLGPQEDISHELDALHDNNEYGKVAQIMRRTRQA